MKTEKPKLSTSESATKTPLWQEIPEDSAETLKGGFGHLAILFLSLPGDPTTRRI